MAFLNGHDNFFSGALRYYQIILHFAFKGCHNFYSWAQNIGLDHNYGRKWKPTNIYLVNTGWFFANYKNKP